jgi:hypothetical protein
MLRECGTEPGWQRDAEHNGQAAYLVLSRAALSDKLLACDDKRPKGMGRKRLYMDRSEETGAAGRRGLIVIYAAGELDGGESDETHLVSPDSTRMEGARYGNPVRHHSARV